jgi:hypothetical protein
VKLRKFGNGDNAAGSVLVVDCTGDKVNARRTQRWMNR